MHDRNRSLILLPGLDGTGIALRPFLAALPAEVKPIVISYPPDRPLSLGQHAELIRRQWPDDDEVVVLAESFSGLVALTLLAEGANRVGRVIFVACTGEPPRPFLLRLAVLIPRLGSLLRATPPVLLRQLCLGPDASDEQVNLLREALSAVSPEVLVHRLGLVAARHSFSHMRFTERCSYLQATQDRLLPRTSGRWFQEHFSSCEIQRLPGPHFLLQAKPRECARLVAELTTFGHDHG